MAKHLARATQEPGVVRKVDDAELLDLHRMGILHSFEQTASTDRVLDGAESPKAWKSPEEDAEKVEAEKPLTDPAANAGKSPAAKKKEA